MFLCACLFFNYTLADVLLKCDLTAEGKQIFQNSIKSRYNCTLDTNNNDYYVLSGLGTDFSTAWNDVVEACSKVYASSSDCESMIYSCIAIQEFPLSGNSFEGTCECVAKVGDSEMCTTIATLYFERFIDISGLMDSGSNSCDTFIKKEKGSFPINCNWNQLYIPFSITRTK